LRVAFGRRDGHIPGVPSSSAKTKPIGPGDQVFLVDGSSFVFRAYFQSINQEARYNYRSDGLPTGAVRLFANKLYQFIKEGAVGVMPTHLGIVFDKAEKTFRNEIYADYKGTRSEVPDDLLPQFSLMREAVRAFGLEPVEQQGFEADDLIATYATQAGAAGADVLIISADKDMMQIVSPHINFYDFESGSRGKPGYRPERRIDVAGVVEYFGVPPEKVIDLQSLVGDTSDNVPGVPGIGPKTAAQLLAEFGDLESLLARAEEIKQPKRRESLITFADQARISKRLVTLDTAVNVETPLSAMKLPEFDAKRLIAFFKSLELLTLTKRVAEASGVDPDSVEADPALKPVPGVRFAGGGAPRASSAAIPAPLPPVTAEKPGSQGALFPEPPPPQKPKSFVAERGDNGSLMELGPPATLAAAMAARDVGLAFDASAYETIRTVERLDAWLEEAVAGGLLAIDTRATSGDPMRADICGISLAVKPGRAAYIPLAHVEGGPADLLAGGLAANQIRAAEVVQRLKPVLEDPSVLKVGHDLKPSWLLLARHGIRVAPYDDVALVAYVLDGSRTSNRIDELSLAWLGHTRKSMDDLTGTGRNRVTFDRLPIDKAAAHSAEDADIILRVWQRLRPRLPAEAMTTVYETLERPLVPVLADMEQAGILVDRQILSRLSGEFGQTMARLENDINELAGEPFNIGSPKQLGDILFGKLQLPGGRKTKTGAWSTDSDMLEDLAAEGHQLPARILDWRQVSKLKSTYTDSLPEYIHPETGRVHTSYALASTTTGRLASSDPNLQNIPVRTDEGRKIRSAFIARAGTKLISADYSQIELRVLAHIADIPQLRNAFAEGLDIHAMTASEMFGVPVEGMDPNVRRRAKAINFGIIYGISAFGLANQLSIGRQEAKDYIDKYFVRFPGIRDYMEASKGYARQYSYVKTLFGRKIHIPQIHSRNVAERSFNERVSINAPIQGSAADIIRRAMARMPAALEEAGLGTRMLLQVHDELVFEAPEAEIAAALPVIKRVMEDAPEPAVKLAVPLQVDARAADNWEAAH
jgi:DNA polymerase-1